MEEYSLSPIFKPVATRKVYQHILGQFVAMVCSGSLKAGDKLPSERELAETMKVSRPSVREALRVLEVIGLVDIHPGGGARLQELELTPFISIIAPLLFTRTNFELELLELRELIETRAMELVQAPLAADDLCRISQAVQEMEAALETNDTEAGALSDIAFHRALLQASRSYVLQKVLEVIVGLFEHSVRGGRALVLERHEDARQLCEDHRNIQQALITGDMAQARKQVKEHLL
ncbi:MAG: FadR family transcriptional regulator, partial [Spirochaetia bacterium]|nr:FadR family transcriptional regulator [Spirochaetia bacterium]